MYVAGYFIGTSVDFDPGSGVDLHSSFGNTDDIYLSKFDSSGTFVWAHTWGGDGEDKGNGVAVNGSGTAYVTGYFTGTSIDFDPDPIEVDSHSSNGGYDIFLSKFLPDGSW